MHQQNIRATATTMTLPPLVAGGFTNLSNLYDEHIPLELRTLLSWGPEFVPPTVAKNLHSEAIKDVSSFDPATCFRQLLLLQYAKLMQNTAKRTPPYKTRVLLHMYAVSKDFLNEHPNLSIIQAYEDRSTVLMETADYRQCMHDCVKKCVAIGECRFFEKDFICIRSEIHSTYSSISQMLLELYAGFENDDKKPFSPKLANLLKEYNREDCQLPYLYGVVQYHKQDFSCRHLYSTKQWYTYPIQQIISGMMNTLKHALSPHDVENIANLSQELHQVPLCEGYQFIKFNVVDMYVRLNRFTIFPFMRNLKATKWFEENCKMPAELFSICLNFTWDAANYFTHNGCIYKHIFGIAEGACDSTFWAKLYLDYITQFHNTTLFERYLIVFWWKTVDSFLLYMPLESANEVRSYLEEITQLKFTIEFEEPDNNGLPSINFLGLQIVRDDEERTEISMYHKPLVSQRLTNYLSHHSLEHKKQSLRVVIEAVLAATSNKKLLADLVFCEQQFYNNSYTALLVGEIFTATIRAEVGNILAGKPA